MKADTNYLSYQLYSNAARTTVWGNSSATGAAHSGTGNSTDLTVYGRVSAGQNVPAGSYSDTAGSQGASPPSSTRLWSQFIMSRWVLLGVGLGWWAMLSEVMACTIGAGSLAFKSYDPIVAHRINALLGVGLFTVQCPVGVAVTSMIEEGLYPASDSTASSPSRRLAAGANRMSHALYQDANRSVVWGNTPASALSYIGSGVTETVSVYALIPSGQNVGTGSYSDSLVITIVY